MNKKITDKVLENHFSYFSFSLYNYPEKYLPIVFPSNAIITEHVAYICPLCLSNYILVTNDEIKFSSEFSLDHFPPKNVDGKNKILTCKACNNDAGTYEVSLENKMNYDSFSNNQPLSSIRKIEFEISDVVGKYQSFMIRDEMGELVIDFPEKSKHSTPFLKEWLKNGSLNDNWTAKLKIPSPDDREILKALLKTAYLTCFYYWGYEFAFSKNGNRIRNVLNDKEDYPNNTPSFWINEKINPKSYHNIPIGISLIERPLEMQCYIANIPLKLKEHKVIASLLIPNPTENGWENLKNVEHYKKVNETITFSFKALTPSLSRNIFNGYTGDWNSLNE